MHTFLKTLMGTCPIILLAMSPAMLNGGTSAKTVTINPEQLTEIVSNAATEEADEMMATFPEVQRTQQSGQKLPPEFTSENIQYTKKFRMEGKQYTLYYLDGAKTVRKNKNIVTYIDFVPDDYSYIEKNGLPQNSPPSMQKFIYHDLGDPENKDYCSVIVNETRCDKNGNNSKFITREIRLPDEIANEIISLANGDTQFRILDRMANMFETVTTP